MENPKNRKFEKVLIVTHIAYNQLTGQPVEGPYSSIYRALKANGLTDSEILEIPLEGFSQATVHLKDGRERLIKLPKTLGKLTVLKYLVDFALTFLFCLKFLLSSSDRKNTLIIGIDPLSCLSLVSLKTFFPFKLVFYSIDFNLNRFKTRVLQGLYEWADKVCSQKASQTWVVCQNLQNYKKEKYQSDSLYLPNSFAFNPSYYEENHSLRTGSRVVWTGSFLTQKQIDDLFKLCRHLQKIRSDLEFWFVPSNKFEELDKAVKEANLKSAVIHKVSGQEPSRRLTAQCDLGLAIYDKNFGSTQFIEPIKIWEYLLCGLPFIISSEPSVNQEIKERRVAYFLNPDNQIPPDGSLEKFIEPENLKSKTEDCLAVAQKYGVVKTVALALASL